MSTTRVHRVLCGIALAQFASSACPVLAQCEQSKFTPPSAGMNEQVGYEISVNGNRMAVGTVSATAVYILQRAGDSWVEEARIQPNDFDPDMTFGRFVSISGDRVLIGAENDSAGAPESGSAYIFRRDAGIWVQEAKLTPSDPIEDARFGANVALAGDVAVVAAGDPSRAYVFRRAGLSWNQEAILFASPMANFQLAEVATDAQTIMVANRGLPDTLISFFRYVGGNWVPESTIPATSILSLSVSGDTAASGNGAVVTTYLRNGATWSTQSELQAVDHQQNQNSAFGRSISLLGDTILVGASNARRHGVGCGLFPGAAYHFQWNGTQWLQVAKIVSAELDEDDEFGWSVGIGAGYFAVASPGTDYQGSAQGVIFSYPSTVITDCNANEVDDVCDISCGVSADCNNNARPDECDIASAQSEDCTLNGIPDECDPDCNNNGVSDTCDLATGTPDCNKNRIPDSCDAPFSCTPKDACLIDSFNGPGESFGSTVAIDGDWAIAASGYWDDGDDGPPFPGSARLFARSGSGWSLHTDVSPPTSQRDVRSAAISGNGLAVADFNNTYVRRRSGSNWTLEAVLPSGPLAMDGDTLLIWDRLYRRSGTSWNLEATLTTPCSPWGGGKIEGNYAIIQCPQFDGSPETPESGAVFIFQKEGSSWVQAAQLQPPDPVYFGHYGTGAAISGNYAVVAEWFSPFGGCIEYHRTGGIYIYQHIGEEWVLIEMFDYSKVGGPGNDAYSIDIEGKQIIVGSASPNSPMVFELDSSGTFWIPKDIPTATQNTASGRAVALSGPWAVVGNTSQKRAYFVAVDDDCNANGKADLCDIDAGIADDADGNDRPDDCTPCGRFAMPDMASGPYPESYPGCLDGTYVPKNRYLSFLPPRTPSGASGLALRVTLTNMPGPSDCERVPDFSAANGAQMWVGPEVYSGSMPTGIHRLQSTPYFFDWELLPDGVVNLSDCNIVPCATYTIEAITNVDYPSGPYSSALEMYTSPVWADIVHRDGGVVPDFVVDFADISSAVDRFRDSPTSPPATWCDLASTNPTQSGPLNIDFFDISTVVDAFRGREYPFPAPTAPMACP